MENSLVYSWMLTDFPLLASVHIPEISVFPKTVNSFAGDREGPL